MSLRDLPTIAQIAAERAGQACAKGPTRLDVKAQADTSDAANLRRWAAAVKLRDKGRCRVCAIRTIATLALDPKRGEAHHLISRSVKVIRHDVRNGLWTCARHHQRLTRHQLIVVATAAQRFVVGGVSYVNGDDPGLTFQEAA